MNEDFYVGQPVQCIDFGSSFSTLGAVPGAKGRIVITSRWYDQIAIKWGCSSRSVWYWYSDAFIKFKTLLEEDDWAQEFIIKL